MAVPQMPANSARSLALGQWRHPYSFHWHQPDAPENLTHPSWSAIYGKGQLLHGVGRVLAEFGQHEHGAILVILVSFPLALQTAPPAGGVRVLPVVLCMLVAHLLVGQS
jgi:hypothetical protein